jgi:hypothetical protein
MSRALGTFAVVLFIATNALAAKISVTPTKLIVVDKLSVAGQAKLVFVAKDGAVTKGTGEDVDQIEVEFDVVYGNRSATGAFILPAGSTNGWLVNKSIVAKYVNKTAPEGPTQVKVGVVKPGKLLKLVGKGLGDVPFDIFAAGVPGHIKGIPGFFKAVQTAYCVTNGGEENCHCSNFDSCTYKLIAAGTGAKLVCKAGTGDPACSAHCFTDTGLTVIDTCTSLEWEKKDTTVRSGVDAGNLHDVDNRYSWAGRCTISGALCQPNAAAATTCGTQTGGALGCTECGVGEGTCDVDALGFGDAITTIWDWVNQVNAASFAGHTDWRLPTSGGSVSFPTGEPAELESIVTLGSGPTIAPIFGPTLDGVFMSASTSSSDPGFNWFVRFTDGSVDYSIKEGRAWVRAVRPAP